jgi:hypothetical protein
VRRRVRVGRTVRRPGPASAGSTLAGPSGGLHASAGSALAGSALAGPSGGLHASAGSASAGPSGGLHGQSDGRIGPPPVGLESGISVDSGPTRRSRPCSYCTGWSRHVAPARVAWTATNRRCRPTNRVCGLPAGPPGRIRWLIGPECCVTGSKRPLELDRGRHGVGPGAARARSVAACATAASLTGAGHGARGAGRPNAGAGRRNGELGTGVGHRASTRAAACCTVPSPTPKRATTDRCESPARRASTTASRRRAPASRRRAPYGSGSRTVRRASRTTRTKLATCANGRMWLGSPP